MEGEEVSVLQNWEKVVVLQYMSKHGLPAWAEGANFFKLLIALCELSEEQAIAAVKQAQEEEEKLHDTTPPEEESNAQC
jgi:hypothetical protein